MWRRWEGAARAGAGGRRWSYSSSTSTSSSRWIRSSTSSSRWIRSPSASSFCHQRLPHLLLLLLTTLSFSFRHLSSLSGNISRQTTKHRIPLNLKNFADSGTALVGRWAGTERGRGGSTHRYPDTATPPNHTPTPDTRHQKRPKNKAKRPQKDAPIQPPRLITGGVRFRAPLP